MQPVKYLFLLAAILVSSAALSQTKNTKAPASAAKPEEKGVETRYGLFTQTIETYYDVVKKQHANGNSVNGSDDTRRLVEYFNSNEELRKKKEKLYGTEYSRPIVFEPLPGESNKIGLLRGIPAPKDPMAAFQADPRENSKYAEKVKRLEDQAKEEARKVVHTTDLMKTYEQGGEEAVKKMYEEKADKSEIVAQMGGSKKLQNMSEKEREEAARKMVAQQTGGLSAEDLKKMTPEQKKALAMQMANNRMNNNGNEVGNAFTQELMINESYRKRYEAMNNAEKQAEYKKFEQRYTGGATVASYKPAENVNEGRAEALEIQEIARTSERLYKELQDELEPVNALALKYEKQWNDDIEMLMNWSERATEALPIVRDSEYGPRRDGIELVLFTQSYMAYAIGKKKIENQKEVWEKYLRVHIRYMQKLDQLHATYSKRTNTTDQMKFAIAELTWQGYGGVLDMNKQASHITGEAGSIQYRYNCEVLRDCSDPRQDKLSQQ